MADEIELIRDDEGIAVFGAPNAVERFLDSVGLRPLSQELQLNRLGATFDSGAKVAAAAADISEHSGRYVKLTKESAEHVKEFGLMPTKAKGISHAMLGTPGSISKWVQIENSPSALLANPAVLTGAAGIMAQLARQQETKELKQLLVTIDGKLDDVRRRQRDEVLAKMGRVAVVIDEAMTIREHGGDRETTWGKVEAESGTIAEVQEDALCAIEALADKADDQASIGTLKKITREIESEVSVWLAVLARCFELQNEYAVLELDHVFDTAPSSLDGHRAGKKESLYKRRNEVLGKAQQLVARLDEIGGIAQANVLLHARASRSVVDSVNTVSRSVEEFHLPLAIKFPREQLTSVRMRDAFRDRQQLRNAAGEAAPKAAAVATTAALIVVGALVKSNDSEDSSEEDPEAQ